MWVLCFSILKTLVILSYCNIIISDATSEFIAGVNGQTDADKGLPCVTVLIGAYLKSTGEPIFGVINQPFYDK